MQSWHPATTWIYHTQRGFLVSKRDADNKGADYTYTSAGRLATRTWARGTTTTYTHNQGMMVTTDYSDATPDVSQTYDNFGRPLVTSNGVSTTTYTYDLATLVLDTETVSLDTNQDSTPELTRTIDRKQDGLFRPTGYALMDGVTVEQETTYTYQNTGRLGTVADTGSTFTYAYLANSNLPSGVTGPVHTVENTYDTTRNVLLTKENKVAASVVSGYTYSVNAIGQRTDAAQSGLAFASARSVLWGYDALGQVVKADSTENSHDRGYAFDAIGNRVGAASGTTDPADASATVYSANGLNQYTALAAPGSTVSPTYDDDGNMVSGPLPAQTGSSNLVWDGENRLISATLPDSSVATFAYDSQSRRIAKTTASATTLYLYEGWNPVAEYSAAAVLEKTYLWGMDLSGSMQGAGGVGGLLAVSQGGSTYYPTYDGNGNISEYVDSTGALAAHYEYDPFGNTTVSTGSAPASFGHRFSTKPLDQATGLYYYGYRYYDPQTGRWPSRDPIEEEGGVNLYGFVGNDGINQWDILGEQGDGCDKKGDEWTEIITADRLLNFSLMHITGHKIDKIGTILTGGSESDALDSAITAQWDTVPCPEGKNVSLMDASSSSINAGTSFLTDIAHMTIRSSEFLSGNYAEVLAKATARFCCSCAPEPGQ